VVHALPRAICFAGTSTDTEPPVLQASFTTLVVGKDYTLPTTTDNDVNTAPKVTCTLGAGKLEYGFNNKSTVDTACRV
jgi:hypothetical protein